MSIPYEFSLQLFGAITVYTVYELVQISKGRPDRKCPKIIEDYSTVVLYINVPFASAVNTQ